MSLFIALEELVPALEAGLNNTDNLADLEVLRIDFLGRKGKLAQIMSRLPELEASERPALGQAANAVKGQLNTLFDNKKITLEAQIEQAKLSRFDASLPGRATWLGSLHPVTLVMQEICSVFKSLGYEIADGPEVENDYHNFEALNIPPDHPARDMQDTLYINSNEKDVMFSNILLRTHTSPVQVRTMLKNKPPVAIIAPGKVYRRDSDITHTPMFHQIEGLLVDKNVSMAHLRGTLTAFVRSIFGSSTKVRFRPSFFPFTEPSVEVDISCFLCGGSGHVHNESCRICKTTGWVEILGAGMVDPAVFESVGYDPELYTGFAFGLGVERIAMLKYGIGDLRMFFENDVRFLGQFS